MHKYILKIDFSKLRKHEIKTLASRAITIVKGYDPETLKINEIYESLVVLEPQIDSLQLEHIAHPLSKNLNALRKQRKALAQGIIKQMETLERGKINGMEESLEVAKPIVLQHLQNFWKYDDNKIFQNINSFFSVMSKDVELQTALETLNLLSYLTNLRIANTTIEAKYNARRKDISERPKSPTPGIVSAVKIALLDLFKQIEVAQVKNQELDYTLLIDELNAEIAEFKKQLKTRASYSKKKAEGVLDDNEIVEDNKVVIEDESENTSEPTQQTQRMYPLNAEAGNEASDQLDKKKTVAVSGKQTRLPIVSDEA